MSYLKILEKAIDVNKKLRKKQKRQIVNTETIEI
jgi:hypothetical protein